MAKIVCRALRQCAEIGEGCLCPGNPHAPAMWIVEDQLRKEEPMETTNAVQTWLWKPHKAISIEITKEPGAEPYLDLAGQGTPDDVEATLERLIIEANEALVLYRQLQAEHSPEAKEVEVLDFDGAPSRTPAVWKYLQENGSGSPAGIAATYTHVTSVQAIKALHWLAGEGRVDPPTASGGGQAMWTMT